jgi:hypothetical protein
LFESFHTIDEVAEMGNGNDGVHEEPYIEVVEVWSPDSRYEVFQVLAVAPECKICESWENRVGEWRRSLGRGRSRRLECNGKFIEFTKHREASGHNIRRDVPRIRYFLKPKFGDVSGGCKKSR